MPSRRRRNKSSKKRSGSRANRQEIGPNSAVLKYTGSLLPIRARNQDQLFVIPLHQNFLVTSTAGFVISGNIDTGAPSGASDWANKAAIFDEFRVLGAHVHYEPVDRYDAPLAVTTAVSQPPLLIAFDRDSSTTPGTTTAIQSYPSCQMKGLSDPWNLNLWKMEGITEATWITTAAPAGSKARGFLWIAANNSSVASTTFGYFFITYLVQFRGINA